MLLSQNFTQGVKGGSILFGAKSMMIDCFLRKRCAACSWYGQQFSQEYHGETWNRMDSTSTLSYSFGGKNVLTLLRFALRNGRARRTLGTFQNVADGVLRWTTPVGVECFIVSSIVNLATTD